MNNRDLRQIHEEVIEEGWGNKIMGAVAIFTAIMPLLLALAPSVLGWMNRRKAKKIVKEMGQEMVDFLIESIQLDATTIRVADHIETKYGDDYLIVEVYIPVDLKEMTDQMLDVLGKDRERINVKHFHRAVVNKAMIKLADDYEFHEAVYEAVVDAHGKRMKSEVTEYMEKLKKRVKAIDKQVPELDRGFEIKDLLSYDEMEDVTKDAFVDLLGRGDIRTLRVHTFFPVLQQTVDRGRVSVFGMGEATEQCVENIVSKAFEIDSYYNNDQTRDLTELSEFVLEESVEGYGIEEADIDEVEERIKNLRFEAKLRNIWTEESELDYKSMMSSIRQLQGEPIVEADLSKSISSGDLVTYLDMTAEEANQAVDIMKSAGRRDSAEMAMRKIDFLIHDRDPEDAENRRKADNIEPINHKLVDDNGYWGETAAIYVNTGDIYNATIIYDVRSREFMLTDVATYKQELDAELSKKAFDGTFDDGIEAGVEASILTTKPFDLSEVRKVMRRNQKCGPLVLRVDDFEKIDVSDDEVALEIKGSLEHKMTRDLQNKVYQSGALNSDYEFAEFKTDLKKSMEAGLDQCLREAAESAGVHVSDVAIHEMNLWIELKLESNQFEGDMLVEALSRTSELVEQKNRMPLKPEIRDRVPTPFDPFMLPRDDDDEKLWYFHDGQFMYGGFKAKAQALDAIHNGHVEPFEINQFDGQSNTLG